MSAAPPGGVLVVDTDVVSFVFKGDTRGDLYRPHVGPGEELNPARVTQLRAEMRKYVLAPFTEAVCLRWTQVMDKARRAGRPVSTTDAWVAATALAYAVPLVTHNAGDFAHIDGLTVISEKAP